MSEQPYKTAKEIAARLNLRPNAVTRWARQGLLPRLKINKRVIRFDPAEVEKFLANRGGCNASHPG